MARAVFTFKKSRTSIAGSFGSADDLRRADAGFVSESCDIAEIRLDLLADGEGGLDAGLWRHLAGVPLLFTARRGSEGGRGNLDAAKRCGLLAMAIEDSALVDIEVASIPEMGALLETIKTRGIPWIASFHDFDRLPDTALLEDAARRAVNAGASAFKVAAMLHSPADMAGLADFQTKDHGLPVATMGMGPLAPVSRLLCAQCGSVLNYGYLGETPTAPGQWDAAFLRQAVRRLARPGADA